LEFGIVLGYAGKHTQKMEESNMKNLLIFTAMLFASVQLSASHLASELNLRLFDQSYFTVTLDNQFFGTPVKRFSIDHLEPGSHYLRVTQLHYSHYGPYAPPVVVFNGYIDVPARSKIHAMIDRQFRFRINKIFALAPAPVFIEPFPYNNPMPANYGMSEYEFNQLRNTISGVSFESSKMQMARQVIAYNFFTSYQVAEILRLMTFESSKLDLAKEAYHKTVDKQNYHRLNELFTFESSVLNLNNYILGG